LENFLPKDAAVLNLSLKHSGLGAMRGEQLSGLPKNFSNLPVFFVSNFEQKEKAWNESKPPRSKGNNKSQESQFPRALRLADEDEPEIANEAIASPVEVQAALVTPAVEKGNARPADINEDRFFGGED
jgi:hypothetical protein